MNYTATFFTHFAAIRFKKSCDRLGWPARLSPVPRSLSSSCGTCVRFDPKTDDVLASVDEKMCEDAERLVQADGDGWRVLWEADNI